MEQVIRLFAVVVSAVLLVACSGGKRLNVLVPDGAATFALMDFEKPLPLDPVPHVAAVSTVDMGTRRGGRGMCLPVSRATR